jgi:hypothetical protein
MERMTTLPVNVLLVILCRVMTGDTGVLNRNMSDGGRLVVSVLPFVNCMAWHGMAWHGRCL